MKSFKHWNPIKETPNILYFIKIEYNNYNTLTIHLNVDDIYEIKIEFKETLAYRTSDDCIYPDESNLPFSYKPYFFFQSRNSIYLEEVKVLGEKNIVNYLIFTDNCYIDIISNDNYPPQIEKL